MTISSQRIAKMNWQCRRGMLELDLILGRFVKNHLNSLSEEQFLSLEKLLSNQDPDLYAWFMGYETPTDKECVDIVNYIRLQDKLS